MSLALVKELLQRSHNSESFSGVIGQYYPRTNLHFREITRAYRTAKDAFRLKERDGGERYFEHLRAVTLLLIEYLRVTDHEMIIAALLHDIVEDIPDWNFERLTSEYGERVSELVWWVTKPEVNAAEFKNKAERERKIIETENFYLPLAVREKILIHEIEEILNELKNGDTH